MDQGLDASQKYTQMAKKPEIADFVLSGTMQTETILTHHLTSIRMATIQRKRKLVWRCVPVSPTCGRMAHLKPAWATPHGDRKSEMCTVGGDGKCCSHS
jgi:hypothetical protein